MAGRLIGKERGKGRCVSVGGEVCECVRGSGHKCRWAASKLEKKRWGKKIDERAVKHRADGQIMWGEDMENKGNR